MQQNKNVQGGILIKVEPTQSQTISNEIENLNRAGSSVCALEGNNVHKICPLPLILQGMHSL